MKRLYQAYFGTDPVTVCPLKPFASGRAYWRLSSAKGTCVAVEGNDRKENEAFIAIARHFMNKGIPVPQLLAVGEDRMTYIQEDLGDDILFDMYVKARRSGEGMEEVESLLCRTISLLPKMQFEGAEGFDFSVCCPQSQFDSRTVLFDLNYFKYCFLKPSGLVFDEMLLQDEFERFADRLAEEEHETFMHRDFNARNVMIRDSRPYFIDFQGGRKGPVHYDVASFVYHARAEYPASLQAKMMDSYLAEAQKYMRIERDEFMERLKWFRLFRMLQVLGAYGFRGLIEQKADFVATIPPALERLRELAPDVRDVFPYMTQVIERLVALPRFARRKDDGVLELTVTSFSYRKGIPHDSTGNGGGYVFDCRALNNPGRYARYKNLTGRDEPVVRFLEEDGGVFSFLDNVYGVLDPHIEVFLNRGFTSLMLSFGCTGGQHRSVYCAEQAARHVAAGYPHVRVRLVHREQNITELFGPVQAM